MQKLVWQNANGVELDLTSGNYGITEWEGFSNASLNIQSQQVPFQDGGVFLDALIEQRELSVTLAMQDNNNLELRYQQRRELISALNPKLGEGYLIYTNDYISKRIKCIPQIPLFETHNSDTVGTPKASLTWVACEPYWEDLEETSVTFKDVQVLENNGDVPVQIKATIPFVSKNPVLMNSRNNKMIGLEGSIANTVNINTNNGEKNVLGEKMSFQWVRGGSFENMISKYGKTFYFAGAVTLEENEMTGELSPSDYNLSDIPISSVAYGNGIFVGIGNNKAYSSYDGINWTLRETFTSITDSVRFVNGRFIAFGGRIQYSYDGINWTSASQVGGNGGLNDVTYGNGKYIAVGFVYNQQLHRVEPNVQISTDCDEWYSGYIPGQVQFSNIEFGNGIFVACDNSNIITTTDGSSWSYNLQANLRDIIFAKGIFIAVGPHGFILTSTDGINWTERNSGVENMLRRIFYNNGKFIVLGDECILESENGIDWTIKYGGEEYSTLESVAHNENIMVAVGYSSIVSSEDGINWTLRKQEVRMKKVIWANNMFVAVGAYFLENEGYMPDIYTSPDGKIWTRQTISGKGELYSVDYGNGLFVAVGIYNGDETFSFIATSPDAINWTVRSNSFKRRLLDIKYHNGIFVAVGDGTQETSPIISSEDGINWTERYSDYLRDFNKITFGDNKFVILGISLSSAFLESSDGISWSEISTIAGTTVRCIVYANDIFLTTGGWKKIFISTDAQEWQQIDTNIFDTLFAADYYKGRWFVFGEHGIIFVSKTSDEKVNLISKLVPNSDMTFNLETGQNDLMFSDNNGKEITITYRQKYIGV